MFFQKNFLLVILFLIYNCRIEGVRLSLLDHDSLHCELELNDPLYEELSAQPLFIKLKKYIQRSYEPYVLPWDLRTYQNKVIGCLIPFIILTICYDFITSDKNLIPSSSLLPLQSPKLLISIWGVFFGIILHSNWINLLSTINEQENYNSKNIKKCLNYCLHHMHENNFNLPIYLHKPIWNADNSSIPEKEMLLVMNYINKADAEANLDRISEAITTKINYYFRNTSIIWNGYKKNFTFVPLPQANAIASEENMFKQENVIYAATMATILFLYLFIYGQINGNI